MKCKICGTAEATVADRDNYPFVQRKEICQACHTEQLKNDLVNIPFIKKREKEVK